MNHTDLVKLLYTRHGEKLPERMEDVNRHKLREFERLNLSAHSTGVDDCRFLYLLILAFRRKYIFEIGSYIGTSAVAMSLAAKQHGGSVTTSDPNDYGCFSEDGGIRFMHAPSSEALGRLKDEGARVDFVFADWPPCSETIEFLNEIGTEDMIFTAHDYKPSNPGGDKGQWAMDSMKNLYARADSGTWFVPERVEVAPNVWINNSTVSLIPNRLLEDL